MAQDIKGQKVHFSQNFDIHSNFFGGVNQNPDPILSADFPWIALEKIIVDKYLS